MHQHSYDVHLMVVPPLPLQLKNECGARHTQLNKKLHASTAAPPVLCSPLGALAWSVRAQSREAAAAGRRPSLSASHTRRRAELDLLFI